MIIELKDISPRELDDFLLTFVENAKSRDGLPVQLAVDAMNDTLSYKSIDAWIYYDEENNYEYVNH